MKTETMAQVAATPAAGNDSWKRMPADEVAGIAGSAAGTAGGKAMSHD